MMSKSHDFANTQVGEAFKSGKKILMVLASSDFRDTEYIVPRSFFEQNNYSVKTASISAISLGRFGYFVMNDYLIEDVSMDDFDGIFFVGGNGSLEYLNNESARNLTTQFLNAGKACGAICAAPRNFITWGICGGRKCTGWNGDGEVPKLCKKYGATFVDQSVVVDGNLVTGNGPMASEEMAVEFMRVM